MIALLAKPLDWWVIRLASRSTGVSEGSLEPSRALAQIVPELHIGRKVSPATPVLNFTADDAFEFTSPVETPAPCNNRVHGRLFKVGQDWRNRPVAILMHGWNAEVCYRHLFPRLARRLSRAGLNTVIFELPYHMQRRPRVGPMNDFISSDLFGMMEATRQAIADARSLCQWCRAQGVPAVGLWGFSLGAWLIGLLTRLEAELSFAVLTTPIARIDRAVATLAFCEPIRRSIVAQPVDLRILNLGTERPLLAPERILLMQSKHDQFAPAETLNELWRAWKEPAMWQLPHGHISLLASGRIFARTVEWISGAVRTA